MWGSRMWLFSMYCDFTAGWFGICIGSWMEEGELYEGMTDAAALIEVSGSRFSNLELIGRGSFGDVYKG